MNASFDIDWLLWSVGIGIQVARFAVFFDASLGPMHFSLIYGRKD